MIEFMKRLLGFSKDKKPSSIEAEQDKNQQDIVDYDGMGNYGRFPKTENGRYK